MYRLNQSKKNKKDRRGHINGTKNERLEVPAETVPSRKGNRGYIPDNDLKLPSHISSILLKLPMVRGQMNTLAGIRTYYVERKEYSLE